MTTPPLHSPRSRLFDRFLDWSLDRESHHRYGDEQERLRYYEGAAVAEGARWHAVLWTLTAMAWTADQSLSSYLLLLFAAFFLPGLLVNLHAARSKVRLSPEGRTTAITPRLVFHVLPVVAFIAGVLRVHAGTDGFLLRVGAGLAAGVTIVALVEHVMGRARHGQPHGDED